MEIMKLPYQDGQSFPFENYFPERNALEKELEKLNQVVKAHKSSEVWKKFNLAATSSTEYGGQINYTRKLTPRSEFFNPWYQSSREIGKYELFSKKRTESEERLSEILQERKAVKRDEEENEEISEIKSETHALSLPPIEKHPHRLSSTISDPVETEGKIRKSKYRDPAMNFQQRYGNRKELRTGTKTFMEKPMGRLLQNMNELPKHTGSDKRISPKSHRNINRSRRGNALTPLKLEQYNKTNPFGLGKS